MSLLTRDEIEQVIKTTDGPKSEWMQYVCRAIEAAVIARLATVSVEPCAIRHSFDGYGYLYGDSGSGSLWEERAMAEPDAEPVYTAEAVAAARVQALEEAENACRVKVQREAGYGGQWEGYGPSMTYRTGPECEAAIRALIGGKE